MRSIREEFVGGETWVFSQKGKYKEEACQGMRKPLLFLNEKAKGLVELMKTGMGKETDR